MRQEKKRVEDPTRAKALSLFGVPSIPVKLKAGVDTGFPDVMFLIPGGKPLFVEFKWPGFTPAPKQVYWHTLLRKLGYEVEVHDTVKGCLEAIRQACARASPSG